MILTNDEKRALAQEIKTILVAESLSIDELDKVESLDGVVSLPSHLTQEGLTKVVAVPVALLRKPAEEAAAAAEEVIARAEEAIVETQTATATANTAVEQVEITKADTILATQEARDAAASVDASKQQALDAAAAALKATESAYKAADDTDATTVILAATGKKLQEDVGAAITDINTAITNAETAATGADEAAGRVEDFIIEAGSGLVTPEDREKWNKGGEDHTHPGDKIIQDPTHRFVTDDEKTNWNGKAAAVHTHTASQVTEDASRVFMTPAERTKLTGITTGANNYTHPANHSASIITEDSSRVFMTPAERTKLTGIESQANKYTHPANHSADMISDSSTKVMMTPAERSKLAGLELKYLQPIDINIEDYNIVILPGKYNILNHASVKNKPSYTNAAMAFCILEVITISSPNGLPIKIIIQNITIYNAMEPTVCRARIQLGGEGFTSWR